jgi:hypothetical protein
MTTRPTHRGDRVEYPVTGADDGFRIVRVTVGFAYPRNGNLHNPSPEFRWELTLDGKLVDSAAKKSILVAAARDYGRSGYEG